MTPLATTVLSLWLVTGLCVGVGLRVVGEPWESSVAAVVGWPLLLHHLRPVGGAPRPAEAQPQGPLAGDIDRGLQRVREVAARSRDGGWGADLDALESALLAADGRLGLADRILADAAAEGGGPALEQDLLALSSSRARVAREIAEVLEELARLRLQMGIVALAGDAVPVRRGLVGLVARVRALDEVSRLGTGGAVSDPG